MLTRRSLLACPFLLSAPRAFADDYQSDSTPWPSALLMATGQPGGAYAVYGPGWGNLVQKVNRVAIAYRASGGAAADILFIEQGAAQLGMTTVTIADQARSGTGQWTAGVKFQAFRALFPMFPSILQIVTLENSGIRSLSDLANRVVGIGPDGGSGAAAVPTIFTDLGVNPRQFVTDSYMPQMRALLSGDLDACAFIGAPPLPAILAVAQTHRLGIIGFTPAEAEQATKKSPGMTAMLLPASTFPNQTTGIASIGTANFAIGSATLPNSLANTLTLVAMKSRAKLAKLIPAVALASQSMLSAQGSMTFHPGAAFALRSLGLDVPSKYIEG